MNDITALMATMKAAAEKAGCEQWQSKKNGPGEYGVMVKGSMVKHSGWSTHRPVCDEAVDKKTADFIAAANPANVRALVEALEAGDTENERMARDLISRNGEIEGLRKRVEELEEIATDYAMKFQRAQDDLKKKALMESRTVTVKLPTGYVVRPGHPINEGERGVMIPKDGGTWLSRFDVEHVLQVAGIQVIEGEA